MARRKKTFVEINPSTVRNVMSQSVATVVSQTSLKTVARLLARNHISCVVVVKDRKPQGIISERDVVSAVAKGVDYLQDSIVANVMSSPVEVLPVYTPLEKAVTMMQEKGYRRFPIVNESGELAGIVTQTDVLRTFSRELAIAHDRMRDMAVHDGLTGLFNCRFFMDALQQQFLVSHRYGDAIALIMLDLDNFKKINDQHGHQYGDMVLREVSEILSKGRKTDLVARFGGEEFIVLAQKIDAEKASRVADRLRESIASTGRTASFGVACYPDPHTMNMEDLIRHADLAMYRSKQTGKNRVTVWTPEMEDFAKVHNPDCESGRTFE